MSDRLYSIDLRAETAIVVGRCAFRKEVVGKFAEAHSRERIPIAYQGSKQHDAKHLRNWVFLKAAALSEMLKLDVEISQKCTKESLTQQSVNMSCSGLA